MPDACVAPAIPLSPAPAAFSVVPDGAAILDGLGDDVFLGVLDLQFILGISHSSIYKRVARGWLPEPTARRPTVWRVSSLRDVVPPHRGRPRVQKG